MPTSPKVFYSHSTLPSWTSRLRRVSSLSLPFFSLIFGVAGFLFGSFAVSRGLIFSPKCLTADPISVSVAWERGSGTVNDRVSLNDGAGVRIGQRERHKVMGFVGVQTGFASVGRRRSLRKTWFPSDRQGLLRLEESTGLAFRFVIGKTKDMKKMADLKKEVQEYDDFLLLDIEEEYNKLPYKTLAFFKSAYALFDSDFYVKADDDIYLRPDRLSLLLAKERSNQQTYLGCMKKGPVFTDPKLKWYEPLSYLLGSEYFLHAYGPIYALSTEVVAGLISLRNDRMASSSKARKSTSEDAHTSYHVYSGVEKAIVGVAKYIEFDLPKHDHIYDRLAKAGILSIISPEGFASFLIREFYNHLEDPNVTELDGGVRSRIQGQHVEITHVDLREEFGLVMSENMPDIVENYRKDRDWTLVNMSLHGNQKKTLTTEVTSLTPDAYLVQDILRNSVMLKSGDTRSITAQLTLFTYYIMEDEPFDMADFILSQIRYTYRLKHPRWVKVHTLPMGLVIQRVLYKKYGWIVQDSYLDDCYPEIYFTGSMKGKKPQRKAQPGIEIREPSISRAGSLRESIDDLRDSLEDHKKEVKKDRSRMQKFMKFLVKGLKLKPTPEEEAEWQVPVEEPPRQSVRRTRRGKAVRRGQPEDCPESSGAGYEDSE